MASVRRQPGPAGEPIRPGMLAWFARNPVAANLLFVLLIVAGVLSVLRTNLEVFPEIEPRVVTVTVAYPGANPEEIEAAVVRRLEEAVADVEGIKRVTGTAAENQAAVTVEAYDFVDMQEFLEDVRSSVERLDTLPAESEDPVIRRASARVQVLSLALYGDVDRATLRELAERVKLDLQQTGAVSQIDISGVAPYEIGIEVREATLRRFGLTFEDVAAAVRGASLDLPGGSLETERQQILLRSVGQAYRTEDFEDIVVRTLPDGSVLRVGDVAEVIDGFEDVDFFVEFDGSPAVTMMAYRIGEEGALNIASTIERYVENAGDLLPPGVKLAIYGDISHALKSRIGLMLKNAALGLMLVVIALGLFLDLRLAFWCAAGLVMSFAASIIVLPIMDVSINMMSLFAFILVLGIVVDDAIVVGENIASHREMGKSPLRASIDGVREVAIPVTMTILTSVVAFAPMLFGSGVIGEILAVIPVVVIAVLVASLVEALLILPAHLAMAEGYEPRWYARVRHGLGGGLARFVNGPYRRLLTRAVKYRYLTVAGGLAVAVVTAGIVVSGTLPYRFFPEVDDDVMTANVEMPPGTSAQQTERVMRRVYDAAAALEEEFADEIGDDGPLIRHIQMAVGGQPFNDLRGGPSGPALFASRDPTIGEVLIELQKGEDRRINAGRVADRWRELVGDVEEARAVDFTYELVTAGSPVQVQLSGESTEDLRAAANWLKQRLATIGGVRDIKDDLQEGKPEIQITGLTATGRALGLTQADVFRQVRGAFYGEEAQRLQRGRDEVRVFVRYPREQRQSVADVETLFIRLPDTGRGVTEAPLSTVATYEVGEGFGVINRRDRRRIVNVTADVAGNVSASDVNGVIRTNFLPEMTRQIQSVTWSLEGEQQEQSESFESLGLSMMVALVGIYGLLAVLFRSYVQPVVVMSAIPFGMVGAVLGHLVMDTFVRPTPLTFISLFGVVALSGIVVNDSLILIDLINRNRMADGDGDTQVEQGVIDAGLRRFRPIFLTTLTTFFGLVPIILETSLQAQFIIPMAVSLGFGVVFATGITLLLVPSLYMIVEDARRGLRPLLGDKVKYVGPGAEPVTA